MHKFITRTLFATAMLALTLNNGIDVWRKLRPELIQTAAVVPVAAREPHAVRQEPVKPAPREIPAPAVQQFAQAVPDQHMQQIAQAIPVMAPLNPVVKPEPSQDRSTARTPEEVSRLLAAIEAENPRKPALTGVQLLPKCVNGKCGRR